MCIRDSNITDLGGISSFGGFGAIDGFNQALKIAYPIYNAANIKPGNIAAAKSLKGDNCAITAYTISIMLGGISIPKHPP